jgi:hypothetical protein
MNSKLIDPKFDAIPADPVELTEAERAQQLQQKPIRGLSINDTIARNANQSVGSRGVDTSAVETGETAGPATTVATTSDDKLG